MLRGASLDYLCVWLDRNRGTEREKEEEEREKVFGSWGLSLSLPLFFFFFPTIEKKNTKSSVITKYCGSCQEPQEGDNWDCGSDFTYESKKKPFRS